MIAKFRNLFSVLMVAAGVLLPVVSYAVIIEVYAGPDTTICYGGNLDISMLEATISGDVTDGTWFTMGDGQFIPTNTSNVQFSLAHYYQPGPTDLTNGSFSLILVSDDPDDMGPMTEVSDIVTITLMTPPPMVCNGSINASLSESCQQEVDVFMLMANPQTPYDMYNITIYDQAGVIIPDNILTSEHVGQSMTFSVGHSCTSNTCGGIITASDNIAPFLNCIDEIIQCDDSAHPESTGFPIPFFATATFVEENTYTITNFDACGEVTLTYEDIVTPMGCANGLSERITRNWESEDIHGNRHTCSQIIDIEAIGLDNVIAPANYDDFDSLALHCDGDWEQLPSGYPSPNHTGVPIFGSCTNIEATYTDLFFDQCGGSYKVVRKWLVVDWCTSESVDINQIIKIKDVKPPSFDCPSDTIIYTNAYTCESEEYQVMFMEEVTDCSDWTYQISVIDANGIDQSAAFVDGLVIEGLPTGIYSINYILTDVCANSDTCSTILEVIDNKAPFAVCDEFTTISLQNFGTARLFATSVDDGSFDNCEIVSYEIQKMTDDCGHSLEWREYADFCCTEVGDTVMVQFRVTDHNGYSNTCMVEVFVEDKLPAEIYCPDDITISCSYSFNENELDVFGQIRESQSDVEPIYIYDTQNNGQVGFDGYFQDNCGATVADTAYINIDCGSGNIQRVFTVTDLDGVTSSCTQIITIVNDDVFTGDDIVWPENYHENGCDTLDASPEIAGIPEFIGEHCSSPNHTYEDQVFYFSGGACVKILRYWTVIDWCLFEINPDEATWTYIQEIKLFNTDAPILAACQDHVVCDFDDCGTHELIEGISATDDCTAPEYLDYTWSLDIDDDGVIDHTGVGDSIMRTVPYGFHRIYWTVMDGCNNDANCDYQIEVKDCKLPTPYCQSSITTTLMPSAGFVTLTPEMYNLDSHDNCTEKPDLQYSFSQDVTDTLLTLTCDDISNGIAEIISLQMWVTDEAGNQDYCSIEVILQDNGDYCQDGTIKGMIGGRVATRTGHVIPDAMVRYDCIIDNFDGETMTGNDGTYETPEIPEYLPYGVRPNYEGGVRGDVNSIDLVFIQRHILNLDTLETPYDIIAADVTKNNRVQPSDLLVIRKFILGLLEEFPKAEKWDFVPLAYEFPDPTDPFDYQDSLEINYLEEELDSMDFVAIRMGNVNGQYNFTNEEETGSRSNENIVLDYTVERIENTDEYTITILAGEQMTFDGLQIGLEVPYGELLSLESEILADIDYLITDGILNIAKVGLGSQLKKGDELFQLTATSEVVNLRPTTDFESFIFNSDKIGLELNPLENISTTDEETKSPIVLANPFVSDLQLNLSEFAEGVLVNIYHIDGSLIYSENHQNDNFQSIRASVFVSQGTYILELTTEDKKITKKIVKI